MKNVEEITNILPENFDLIQETTVAQLSEAEGKSVKLPPKLHLPQTSRGYGTDLISLSQTSRGYGTTLFLYHRPVGSVVQILYLPHRFPGVVGQTHSSPHKG